MAAIDQNGGPMAIEIQRGNRGGWSCSTPLVDLGHRPPVEDLDNVELPGDSLDCLYSRVSTSRIVRMFDVDEADLLLMAAIASSGQKRLGTACFRNSPIGSPSLVRMSCPDGGRLRLQ